MAGKKDVRFGELMAKLDQPGAVTTVGSPLPPLPAQHQHRTPCLAFTKDSITGSYHTNDDVMQKGSSCSVGSEMDVHRSCGGGAIATGAPTKIAYSTRLVTWDGEYTDGGLHMSERDDKSRTLSGTKRPFPSSSTVTRTTGASSVESKLVPKPFVPTAQQSCCVSSSVVSTVTNTVNSSHTSSGCCSSTSYDVSDNGYDVIKVVECKSCGIPVKNRAHLEQHMRDVHQVSRHRNAIVHKCEACGAEYGRQQDYAHHMNKHHVKVRW